MGLLVDSRGVVDQPVLRDCQLLLRGKNYAGVGDWLDESGNGFNGSITDAAFDKTRKAFLFNSSTSRIAVAHSSILDLGTSGTITVMAAYEYTLTTGFQFVAGKEQYAGTIYPGYALEHNPSGPYLTGFITDGTNTQSIADLGAGVVTPGEQYVAAVTIDLATSDLIRGYWNGVQIYNGVTTSAIGNPSNSYDFTIGQSYAATDPFKGYIYAVAFWNRVLSHSEVAAATIALRPTSQTLRVWHPLAPGVTYQYAYPISDISSTDWDTAPTASQSLYVQLDEETRSDTDYIFYSP